MRAISISIYRKVHDSLNKLDDKLRPQPMTSDGEGANDPAKESEGAISTTDELPTTTTR